MKKYGIIIAVSAVLVSAVVAQVLYAQPQEGQLKPGDSPLYATVEMNCLDVKMELSKIYEQDGLNRVNAGQLYETMSSRLMTRLNAKVVSDRLDGTELVRIAADYEDALQEFRDEYHDYEVAMNALLKADCQSRQQAFYLALTEVRASREAVYESVEAIDTATKEYYEAYEEFRDDYLSDADDTPPAREDANSVE